MSIAPSDAKEFLARASKMPVMTLSELLPLARELDSDERLALAEEMWQSVYDEKPIDPGVLDLVEQRVARIRSHPEESITWDEFKTLINTRLGSVPA